MEPIVLPSTSPHVLIFMYYDTNHGYEELTREMNESYCGEHGYTFVALTKGYEDIPPWWRKVFLLRDLIKQYPWVHYFMWIDSDAAFVKQRYIPVGHLFEENQGVIHAGTDPIPEVMGRLNAGVFAIRNCPLGRQFVKEWISYFRPETWCSTNVNPNCNFKLDLGAWRTTGEWGQETFEQGIMNQLAQKDMYKAHVVAYEPHFFSELDASKVSFVQHMMGKSIEDRLQTFRLVHQQAKSYAKKPRGSYK